MPVHVYAYLYIPVCALCIFIHGGNYADVCIHESVVYLCILFIIT